MQRKSAEIGGSIGRYRRVGSNLLQKRNKVFCLPNVPRNGFLKYVSTQHRIGHESI